LGSAARKVKGGKLLRVNLEHDGKVMTSIAITGDFFFYPEEGLAVLERRLAGKAIGSEDELTKIIAAILSEEDFTPLGFGPSDLAQAILEAR
jgi:lipoate-protein ligase A